VRIDRTSPDRVCIGPGVRCMGHNSYDSSGISSIGGRIAFRPQFTILLDVFLEYDLLFFSILHTCIHDCFNRTRILPSMQSKQNNTPSVFCYSGRLCRTDSIRDMYPYAHMAGCVGGEGARGRGVCETPPRVSRCVDGGQRRHMDHSSLSPAPRPPLLLLFPPAVRRHLPFFGPCMDDLRMTHVGGVGVERFLFLLATNRIVVLC
jgi:hypothetical protein